MKYEVLVTQTATRELNEAYDWLASQTANAATWYNGLLDAILSPEDLAARCPLAPDADEADPPSRQLLYGDKRHAYRIVFEIRGSQVIILHILHAARGSSEA